MGHVEKQPGADDELGSAIQQAHKFGCKTADGRRLLVSGQVVLQLREAIGRDDWERVENILLTNKMGDSDELIKTVYFLHSSIYSNRILMENHRSKWQLLTIRWC